MEGGLSRSKRATQEEVDKRRKAVARIKEAAHKLREQEEEVMSKMKETLPNISEVVFGTKPVESATSLVTVANPLEGLDRARLG